MLLVPAPRSPRPLLPLMPLVCVAVPGRWKQRTHRTQHPRCHGSLLVSRGGGRGCAAGARQQGGPTPRHGVGGGHRGRLTDHPHGRRHTGEVRHRDHAGGREAQHAAPILRRGQSQHGADAAARYLQRGGRDGRRSSRALGSAASSLQSALVVERPNPASHTGLADVQARLERSRIHHWHAHRRVEFEPASRRAGGPRPQGPQGRGAAEVAGRAVSLPRHPRRHRGRARGARGARTGGCTGAGGREEAPPPPPPPSPQGAAARVAAGRRPAGSCAGGGSARRAAAPAVGDEAAATARRQGRRRSVG